MKKRIWVLVAVALLIFGISLTLAQNKTTLSFKVSFPFKVGDQTFPAGDYRLSYDGRDSRHLSLYDNKTNEKQFITFVTRLSGRNDGGVVFDSINKVRYLSEVYMNGADGFQIRATPEEHSHENIQTAKVNQ